MDNKGNSLCKVCNITMQTNSLKSHFSGKKHLKNVPNKLTVKGKFASNDEDKLKEYFAMFGDISSFAIKTINDEIQLEISFSDQTVFTDVIQISHKFNGEPLEISWANMQQLTEPNRSITKTLPKTVVVNIDINKRKPDPSFVPPSKKKKAKPALPDTDIVNKMKTVSTFDEQIRILKAELKEDDEQIKKKRHLLYDDLWVALSKNFKKFRIYYFGSSVTGLDYKGSDLDIFVERYTKETEEMKLKRIRKMLYQSKKFSDILVIPSAKVPIIKCIHTATQICCDINIKNKLPVANSQLIKYYLDLDEKLTPLVIAIKYWLEYHGMKKVNFFSSYALYMLIIFYLQHEPYSLPAVFMLTATAKRVIQAGWNCGFSKLQVVFKNNSLKEASLFELFKGFFEFYSKFDYLSQIVCPFLGNALKKIHFIPPCDSLPDCYAHYKKIALDRNTTLDVNAPMCIQDPFEHNRNVAASVPIATVGKFINYCKSYAGRFITNQLFTEALIPPSIASNIFEFDLLRSKPDENSTQTDAEWHELAKELMHKVLTEIFSFQAKNVPCKDTDIMYLCDGGLNIWDNRHTIHKNLLALLPSDINLLDQEIAVTTYIQKFLQQRLTIKVIVWLKSRTNPSRLNIKMQVTAAKKYKSYPQFLHFLQLKLPVFMEIITKPQKQDYSQQIQEVVEELAAQNRNLDTIIIENKHPTSNMTQEEKKITNEKPRDNNVTEEAPNQPVNSEVNIAKEESVKQNANDKKTDSAEVEIVASKPEEDDEDVPADFFDDFANDDFMDGLDIVDAWDDDIPDEKSNSSAKVNDVSCVKTDFSRTSQKRRRSSETHSKNSRSPHKRQHKESPHKSHRSRSRSRGKKRSVDIRRDPEKTKRDIHRDKITKNKDKEQKLVSDKLRLVETGLVPPGTEMEVDLNSVLKSTRIVQKSEERIVERRHSRKSRSSSREMRRRHSRSPYKHSARSRRRSGSRESNLSERELWIRGRNRSRSRSRKRSRSRDTPLRAMARKYEEKKKFEAKKKKSFLEEIREKLNEVSRPLPSPPIVPYTHNVMPQYVGPVPAPVPAPTQYFPQHAPVAPQYDQNFFIGDSFNAAANANVNQQQPIMFCNPSAPIPVASPQITNNVQAPPARVEVPTINLPSIIQDVVRNVMNSAAVKRNTEQTVQEATADVDKLFADKKISLTDFLTITAKPEVHSSSPEHLQKKIKVISRCQDAIKAMSDERKFNGRLSVKSSAAQSKASSDGTFQSPLRKIPIVRFQYTTPAKPSDEADAFAVALDSILMKIGLIQETVNLDDLPDSKVSSYTVVDDRTTSTISRNSVKAVDRAKDCEECRKRKLKSYSEVGSQCVDIKETAEIGTQVSEQDLSPTKMFAKNDSLAYLTPAQLLGKQKDKDVVVMNNTHEKESPPEKINENNKGGFRNKDSTRKAAGRGRPNPIYNDPYPRNRPIDLFGSRLGPPPYQQPIPHRSFMNPEMSNRMSQFRNDVDLYIDFNQELDHRARQIDRYGPRF